MQYLLLLHADENGWSKMTEAEQQQGYGGLYGVYRGAEKGGRVVRVESASAGLVRDHREDRQWQAAGAGRTVCGFEGATRRLLPDRSAGSRCGDRLGAPLPGLRSTARSRCARSGRCRPRRHTAMSVREGEVKEGDEQARRPRRRSRAAATASSSPFLRRARAMWRRPRTRCRRRSLRRWRIGRVNGCPANPEGVAADGRPPQDHRCRAATRDSGERAAEQLQILAEGLEAAAAATRKFLTGAWR